MMTSEEFFQKYKGKEMRLKYFSPGVYVIPTLIHTEMPGQVLCSIHNKFKLEPEEKEYIWYYVQHEKELFQWEELIPTYRYKLKVKAKKKKKEALWHNTAFDRTAINEIIQQYHANSDILRQFQGIWQSSERPEISEQEEQRARAQAEMLEAYNQRLADLLAGQVEHEQPHT